jgi:biopolymer transport protein ExbD
MKIELPKDPGGAFQMAPLIDVVFLLIIFFMVVAKMNQQERIPVQIPVASHSVRPDDPSGRGTVSIKENGDIFAGVEQVSPEQLLDLTRLRLKENPRFKLFLRADRRTPHEHVRTVMQTMAEAGVVDIIFSSYEAD